MCFWKNPKIIFANFFACCILQQNTTQISILHLQGNVQLVVLFPQTGPSAYHQLKSKEFRLSIFTLELKSSWCFQPEQKICPSHNWEKISSNLGMKNYTTTFASFLHSLLKGPARCAGFFILPSTRNTQKAANTRCLTNPWHQCIVYLP